MTIKVTGLQESLDALDVFKRVQIPFAASWGLNQLAFMLRKNEQEVMSKTFNRLSKFTLNAPLFTRSDKQNLSIKFFLRDNAPGGQSPDRYLFPQAEGGEVYVTRFSRALRRRGVIPETDYVLHWQNPKYKPTPGRIQSILASLSKNTGPVRSGAQYKRNLSQVGKYFLRGMDKIKPAGGAVVGERDNESDNGYRGAGIYTRKASGQLELIYRIVRGLPEVPKKYDWSEQRIGAFAQEKLPDLILGKLKAL